MACIEMLKEVYRSRSRLDMGADFADDHLTISSSTNHESQGCKEKEQEDA